MTLFVLYGAFIALVSVFERPNALRTCLFIYLLAPIFLVGFFRNGIGTDWDSYESIYEAIGDGLYFYEPGWVAINLLANLVGTFHATIFLGYLIVFTIIVWLIYDTRSFGAALAIFCLFRAGVFFTRIELAAFVVCAGLHLADRRPRLSLSLLLAASLLHWSAVIVLLSFLVVRLYRSGARYLPLLMLAIIAISPVIAAQASDSIATHLFEVESSYEGGAIRLLVKSFSIAMLLWIASRHEHTSKGVIPFGWIILVATTIGALVSPGVERLYVYTYPVVILAVATAWSSLRIGDRSMCALVLLAIFGGWLRSPFNDLYFPLAIVGI